MSSGADSGLMWHDEQLAAVFRGDRGEASTHVAGCPLCRAGLREVAETLGALAYETQVEASRLRGGMRWDAKQRTVSWEIVKLESAGCLALVEWTSRGANPAALTGRSLVLLDADGRGSVVLQNEAGWMDCVALDLLAANGLLDVTVQPLEQASVRKAAPLADFGALLATSSQEALRSLLDLVGAFPPREAEVRAIWRSVRAALSDVPPRLVASADKLLPTTFPVLSAIDAAAVMPVDLTVSPRDVHVLLMPPDDDHREVRLSIALAPSALSRGSSESRLLGLRCVADTPPPEDVLLRMMTEFEITGGGESFGWTGLLVGRTCEIKLTEGDALVTAGQFKALRDWLRAAQLELVGL